MILYFLLWLVMIFAVLFWGSWIIGAFLAELWGFANRCKLDRAWLNDRMFGWTDADRLGSEFACRVLCIFVISSPVTSVLLLETTMQDFLWTDVYTLLAIGCVAFPSLLRFILDISKSLKHNMKTGESVKITELENKIETLENKMESQKEK